MYKDLKLITLQAELKDGSVKRIAVMPSGLVGAPEEVAKRLLEHRLLVALEDLLEKEPV